MLDELHPRIARDNDRVTVTGDLDERVALDGAGLALMPSAFVWPSVLVIHDAPGWPVTIVYPARGIAELWSRPPTPPTALVAVLGRTRALLLADIADPATTSTLARRHHLSPAAVSAQLTALRDAHLATAQRIGKQVYYQRTPTADTLLRTTTPPP